MDDLKTSVPQDFWSWITPGQKAYDTGLVEIVASTHKQLLPWTATSRAGYDALKEVYTLTLTSANGFLLAKRVAGSIAFLSATDALDDLENYIKLNLSWKNFIKILLFHLLNPSHLMASFKLKKHISRLPSLYILTFGISKKDKNNYTTGRELLLELESRAKGRFQEIYTDTEKSNSRALNFYLKNGFEEVASLFGHVLLKKRIS